MLRTSLIPPRHALHDMLSTILRRSMGLQAAPAQKNLGTSGELDVAQPAQASASRPQAVGTASQLRTAAFKLLLMGCRSSGAAFIKWGQWSATREDIFPAVSQSMQHTASKIDAFTHAFEICLEQRVEDSTPTSLLLILSLGSCSHEMSIFKVVLASVEACLLQATVQE